MSIRLGLKNKDADAGRLRMQILWHHQIDEGGEGSLGCAKVSKPKHPKAKPYGSK
jgi:hypothetical protein